MLKQFSGSPINLYLQIGILSLANADSIKGLAIKKVQSFIRLYLSVPVWPLLFVPVRLVGITCIRTL